VLTFVPACSNSYGYSSGWCWFVNDNWGNAWKFVAFYIPLWCVIAYLCLVYYQIHYTVKAEHQHQQLGTVTGNDQVEDTEVVTDVGQEVPEPSANNAETQRREREAKQAREKMMNRLKWFPALLIGCYTFATINRIYSAATGDAIFGLAVLHFLGIRFRGFFNFLLYGLNAPLIRAIKKDVVLIQLLLLNNLLNKNNIKRTKQTVNLFQKIFDEKKRAGNNILGKK